MTKIITLLCLICLLQAYLPHVEAKRKKSSGSSKKVKAKKEGTLGQVRVLLLSPGYPWQFGAYQNQQALLGVELVNHGFDVFWNSAFRQMEGNRGVHTPLEAVAAEENGPNKPPTPFGKQLERAKLFSYIGVPLPPAFQALGRGVLASAVNSQLRRHSIDAIICLIDANQIFMDEMFDAFSVMWFPNHFSSLVKPQENVLNKFDVVASLAPSDAAMLRADKYHLKRVTVIPHIIEKPPDLYTLSLRILRKKYQIPQKAWVVLVNCGNYDNNNRKSIDTMLLAFKAFQEEVPEAFLYMKAIASREIMMSEGYPRNMKMDDHGLPVYDMIDMIGLVEGSYLVQTEIIDATGAWELMLLADALLMPSKSEGFGLPMLEAQLMGVPVVTTRFGAMKDYTMNGISVPPSQPIFLTAGMAVMPDLYGVIAALKSIHAGELNSSLKNSTIDWITEHMSSQTVGQQFRTLIGDGVSAKAVDTLFQRHDTGNSLPSSAPSAAREATMDIGENTDEYFYSLMHQQPERYQQLLDMPKGDIPSWVLLWSNVSTMDFNQIDNIRKQGWGTTIPPIEGDILFLLTQKPDGSTFPRDSDLQMGNLDPDGVVMIRTDRYLAAVKYLAVEAASIGGTPTAYDALRASLAQKSPIKRPMNIKVIHVVVAKIKPSFKRKKTQIVQED